MKKHTAEQDKEQALLRQIRDELDASSELLDIETSERLESIRRKVLAGAFSKPQAKSLRFYYPATVILTASMLVSILVFFNTRDTHQADNIFLSDLIPEDIEILITEDDLEFYEEIDFYQWLSMNETF